MDRNRIKRIMEDLEDITEIYSNDEFNLAMYVYIRYGKFEFDNYICDDELEEINKVLKRNNTLFNEDINDDVRLILNDDLED